MLIQLSAILYNCVIYRLEVFAKHQTFGNYYTFPLNFDLRKMQGVDDQIVPSL